MKKKKKNEGKAIKREVSTLISGPSANSSHAITHQVYWVSEEVGNVREGRFIEVDSYMYICTCLQIARLTLHIYACMYILASAAVCSLLV